jgi:hypothetical protein
MQTDFLQFIYQAINNLLTQNLGFFDAMGQNLFRMFATILVAWYGVKSALSAASGRHFLHFDNFASLILTISFGFGMINYYSNPIPGIGTSFHNLITDESQFLANRITQQQLQVVVDGVSDFESRLNSPTFGDSNLRRGNHPACSGSGHCHCRDRVWIHRNCGLRLGGADLHSLLHRAQARMAVLGLV